MIKRNLGHTLESLISDEIYNSKVNIIEEAITRLYMERDNISGYIEQSRGILKAIEVLEYMKDDV